MAKNDYNRIVCLILTYLYARLQGEQETSPESFLQPMTKDFPIPEEYFFFILESMAKEDLIDGISFVKAWGGDIINISDMSRIRITPNGIRYLTENKTMRGVLEWLRDHAVDMPGMVTTVLGILND